MEGAEVEVTSSRNRTDYRCGDDHVDKVMAEALNVLLTPYQGSGSPDLDDSTTGEQEQITDEFLDSELENAGRLALSLDKFLMNDDKVGQLQIRERCTNR